VQAAFIPFLRRPLLFEICSGIVPISLWIGAIFTPYPGKLALLVLANAIEHPTFIIASSPIYERLVLPKGVTRSPNITRYVERYESFFIIILGEGIFRMIEGSPSGPGLNERTGTVLTAVLMFYVLHWLYFNSDQSKEYVQALRRTWWKPVLWQT